jgi:hypothetical protein
MCGINSTIHCNDCNGDLPFTVHRSLKLDGMCYSLLQKRYSKQAHVFFSAKQLGLLYKPEYKAIPYYSREKIRKFILDKCECHIIMKILRKGKNYTIKK